MDRITVKKHDENELKALGVFTWPVWEKEISRFEWSYDQAEECYFLKGRVTIESDCGSVSFGKGDYVIFPKGLSCVWNVLEPVRKHYKFK